jgi:hypothetical protein
MLIIAIAIWIILLLFVLALCRVAAEGDDIEAALASQAPAGSTVGVRSAAGGLVVWEEEIQPLGQDGLAGTAALLRHAGRFAAGS